MTKREEALENLKRVRELRRKSDGIGFTYHGELTDAIADYLLADDEPAKTVDRSLRGPVIVEYADRKKWPGIATQKEVAVSEISGGFVIKWAWGEFEEQGWTVRKMTAADLEATDD